MQTRTGCAALAVLLSLNFAAPVFAQQANAGKVPSSIKQWRESNGGTHAVMATGYVKKDGTKEDVEKGLYEAANSVDK